MCNMCIRSAAYAQTVGFRQDVRFAGEAAYRRTIHLLMLRVRAEKLTPISLTGV